MTSYIHLLADLNISASFKEKAQACKARANSAKKKLKCLNQLVHVPAVIANLVKVSISIKNIALEIIEKDVILDIIKTVVNTQGAVSSGEEGGSRFTVILSKCSSGLKWLGLFSVVTIPFKVYKVFKNTILIFCGPAPVDHGFDAIGAIGQLFESLVSVTKGLIVLNVFPVSSSGIVIPFAIVAICLKLFSEMSHVYSMGQTFLYARKFKSLCEITPEGLSQESFERALEFLTTKPEMTKRARKKCWYYLGKHFMVDGKKFDKRIHALHKASAGFSAAQRVKTVATLNQQMKIKQVLTGARFISELVGMVAIPVFVVAAFIFPPILPAGFVCVAIASGSSVALFALSYFSERYFNKKIEGYCRLSFK